MFETLEDVGESSWTSFYQAGLFWMFRGLVLPVKLRGGISSFSARSRSWVDVELGRIGAEPVGLGIVEPEAVREESLKLVLPHTKRLQLELPFERERVPAEDVQQDLWPEGLGSRAKFTAVNKIASECGPLVDERDFLGIVAAPVFEEARHRARNLALRDMSATQTAFRQALVDASVARSPQKIIWGEESCVDALRLRYIGHVDWNVLEDRRSVDDAVWLGALDWLGKRLTASGQRSALSHQLVAPGASRLGHRDYSCVDTKEITISTKAEKDASKAPRKAWRVLATSVASSGGYRKSFDLLRSWFGKGRHFSWVSLIVLRCVFDGWMVPDIVSSLIPPPADSTRRLRNDSLWLPLSLALRWAFKHGHQAGVVFTLSAILATAFRRSLESAAVQERVEIDLTPWGCGSLPEGQMVICSDLLRCLCSKGWSPWKEGPLQAAEDGTDLDLSELASILGRPLADMDLFHLGLLCLDEHLLHATFFTLFGNIPSARVHLALSARPLWTRRLRVASEIDENEPTLLNFLETSPLGSERAKVYSALEGTPDPSVALGTPVWSLTDRLGDVASVFMRARKGPALRSVRSLLQREDLKKAVRPYWLLSRRDKAGLVAAMKWAGVSEPYPEEEAWWGFLESQAQQLLEARPWTD